jgi:hypothetical protein
LAQNPPRLDALVLINMEEPDIVDYLTAMHHEVKQLFEQAETGNTKLAAREGITPLALLSQIHQAQIHPVILDSIQRGREIVAHYVYTHQVLENLMRDLDNSDAGTPAFTSQLRRIATAFEKFRQGSAIALCMRI